MDGEVVGAIQHGHLLLVGFRDGDGPGELEWMADKVIGLRVFPDEQGRMNRSLEDVAGSLLVVSQFTLYGDTRKGRRPSFVGATGDSSSCSRNVACLWRPGFSVP